MNLQILVSVILITCGLFFMFSGSIGLLRLPDFFSRTHAASNIDMLGVIFTMSGLIVYEGFTLTSLKLLLIFLFIVLANPIGSHALGKSAFESGVYPMLRSKKKSSNEGDE
jgi:multicomponent Na+:H+ antiporter subunit G